MAEYRTVNCKLWEDDWFHSLDAEGRVVWLWLITNHRASISGIYSAPVRIVSYETGVSEKACLDMLKAFEECGKIHYENGVVWVHKLRTYQCTNSPSLGAKAEKDVRLISPGRVLDAYIEHYGQKNDRVSTGCQQGASTVPTPSRQGASTVPTGCGQGVDTNRTITSTITSTSTRRDVPPNPLKGEVSKSGGAKKSGLLAMPEDMAEIWDIYPKHDDKAYAIKKWLETARERPSNAEFAETLRWQIDVRQWTKEADRYPYIPAFGVYLNKRRWTDEKPTLITNGGNNGRNQELDASNPYEAALIDLGQ